MAFAEGPGAQKNWAPWRPAGPTAELERPDQGTAPPRQGLASSEQDGQSAQQRKERGILFWRLTKNSGSGWTRMMKSLFSRTRTPGRVLKGYPRRPLPVPRGGLFGHHLQGVSGLPVREGCCSHRGRATVWASHLQLINSSTLILTADHN